MTQFDLTATSVDALDDLINQAHQRKEELRQKELATLRQQAEWVMTEAKRLSVSVASLLKPEPAKVKYRHPDQPLTWSGRGKQPIWLRNIIEQTGKSLEDFAVTE